MRALFLSVFLLASSVQAQGAQDPSNNLATYDPARVVLGATQPDGSRTVTFTLVEAEVAAMQAAWRGSRKYARDSGQAAPVIKLFLFRQLWSGVARHYRTALRWHRELQAADDIDPATLEASVSAADI